MLYKEESILRVAKRLRNKNRRYVLVNPLQAKYMPTRPRDALSMMGALASEVQKRASDVKLVIGFAETATAIGAVVSSYMPPDCVYIHTTRENVRGGVTFLEEHSHAKSHTLYSFHLEEWIKASPTVVFVDDEITTGKTVINMINALPPVIREKRLIFASIINRLSVEDEQRLTDLGVELVYLLKTAYSEYTDYINGFQVHVPRSLSGIGYQREISRPNLRFMDPRYGVGSRRYNFECFDLAVELADFLKPHLSSNSDVLVIGTEECMYPSLVLGRLLETGHCTRSVRCQSTARNPIGVCLDGDYPIRNGYMAESVYSNQRSTYLYNMAHYDTVIVVTDNQSFRRKAMTDLLGIFAAYGCKSAFFIREGGITHVRNIQIQ